MEQKKIPAYFGYKSMPGRVTVDKAIAQANAEGFRVDQVVVTEWLPSDPGAPTSMWNAYEGFLLCTKIEP